MNEPQLEIIRQKLKSILSEKRYLHSLGTEQTAVELAEKFNVDVYKAAISGLLHDCAKYMTKYEIKNFIIEKMITVPFNVNYPLATLHAFVSAYLAKHEYGVTDEEIIAAIKHHTIGVEEMTTLEKIVFIADKIELSTRKTEASKMVRQILQETNDLNQTLLAVYSQTIIHLINNKQHISPQSILNWNHLLEKLNINSSVTN